MEQFRQEMEAAAIEPVASSPHHASTLERVGAPLFTVRSNSSNSSKANRKDGSQFAESGPVPSGVGELLPGATRAERRASVAAMQPV